jgi:tetratricopeptide (TPR) repeat protein
MKAFEYGLSRKDLFLIFAAVGAALALRFLFLIDYRGTDSYAVLAFSDSDYYLNLARGIASGNFSAGEAFARWPFYGYALAAVLWLSDNSLLAVYGFQLLLGALNCAFVYAAARIIFNRLAGVIAALLYAWYGLFIFYEGLLVYTALSLFLNSLLFLCYLYLYRGYSPKKLFLLGVFAGICVITQANIAVFAAAGALFILWRSEVTILRAGRKFLYFFCGMALVIAAVAARNTWAEKDLVLLNSNSGLNFYIGNNPQTDGLFRIPAYLTPTGVHMLRDSRLIAQAVSGRQLKSSEYSDFWFRKAVSFIRENPLAYLRLLGRKAAYLFSPREHIYEPEWRDIEGRIRVFRILFLDLRIILPLAIAGMLLCLKDFRRVALLYLAVATVSLSIIIFFVQTKFRIMLVPFFVIFAAGAVSCLWRMFREGKFFKCALCAAALALAWLYSSSPRPASAADKSSAEYALRFSRFLKYEKAGDYPRALEEAKALERIKPDYHYLAYCSGTVYYHSGDYRAAEEKFKASLRIAPFFTDAYYNLGFLYNGQKRFSEARDILVRGLALDADDPGMRFELGKAYKGAGGFKQAAEEFKLALSKLDRWRQKDRALVERELKDSGG